MMEALVATLVGSLLLLLLAVQGDEQYVMSAQGQSCATACSMQGRSCIPDVQTNNSAALFKALGVVCTLDPSPWWAPDQPSYCSDPSDENYGKCVGYINVPSNQ